jgi:VIT1/CCC1 family predicted Fe2+/Mn2+ transporter
MTDGAEEKRSSSKWRVLDPISRCSEVLFGLIMVLTFTSSISAAEGEESQIHTLLVSAIGCNLAWGIVDAFMYLMAQLTERGRSIHLVRALKRITDTQRAHRLIAEALPPKVAETLDEPEFEKIRRHLVEDVPLPDRPSFSTRDYVGAFAVFLLVFLSTFPVVVPFLLIEHVKLAVRASNAVAIALLFLVGFRLGKHAGDRPWLWGFTLVVLSSVLVAITIVLGG